MWRSFHRGLHSGRTVRERGLASSKAYSLASVVVLICTKRDRHFYVRLGGGTGAERNGGIDVTCSACLAPRMNFRCSFGMGANEMM